MAQTAKTLDTSVILQSPAYDGVTGNGEQIPLPMAKATWQGVSMAEVISLFGSATEGEEPENLAIDLGQLKEAIQVTGQLSSTTAKLLELREGGPQEFYQSAIAMRDALRRTRRDWPLQSVSASATGTWGDTGLADDQEDSSTNRAVGTARLLFGHHDNPNTGEPFGRLAMYGAVGQFDIQLQGGLTRDTIPYSVTFLPTRVVFIAARGLIVDDYNDQNYDEWNLSLGNWDFETSSPKEGVAAARTPSDGSGSRLAQSEPGSVLPDLEAYPEVGDTHRFWMKAGGFPGPQSLPLTAWGGGPTGYGVHLLPNITGGSRWRLVLTTGGGSGAGSHEILDEVVKSSINEDEWYEWEIYHDPNGKLTATRYDANGNQLDKNAAVDTRRMIKDPVTGDAVYESRIVSMHHPDSVGYWDFWRITQIGGQRRSQVEDF